MAKYINDKIAKRISDLCNDAAGKAIVHRTAADKAWESINKVMHREIDTMEDFGADDFVDIIDYGTRTTPEEVKRLIAVLKENRDAESGLVRK